MRKIQLHNATSNLLYYLHALLHWYVVLTLNLVQLNPEEEVQLQRYGRGSYFGELALLQNQPRAASALADGDCQCAGMQGWITFVKGGLYCSAHSGKLILWRYLISPNLGYTYFKNTSSLVFHYFSEENWFHAVLNIFSSHAVLDVQAFERLLGPCKELLMRNIPIYEQQLSQICQDMNI